ncbi:MAG: GGDEF domain-containing protein [Alphaproteobacteria bacterium]|nr:GGDEF domain-containing protein [Alphaproteobacteria bacterium]
MYRQVLTIALAALAASVTCTFLLMRLNGANDEAMTMALSIATIVPLVVSIPSALFLFRQREKADQLHRDLLAAHEELRSLHEQAVHRASIDQMTGLLNRESFLTKTKYRRRKADAGFLMMIDVDCFKQINDRYGHQAGDGALLAIVSILNRHIRRSDILGRLGGEEFALFVSDLAPEKAWEMAEDIRQSVERLPFQPHEGVIHPITVSIGIAPAPVRERMHAIMNHADQSLYAAKRSGRNRVAYRNPENREKAEMKIQHSLSRVS